MKQNAISAPSFQSAAALGNVVMVVSISNCCPVTSAEQ
jgi:hypothetical protein